MHVPHSEESQWPTQVGVGAAACHRGRTLPKCRFLWPGGVWNGSHVPYMSPVNRCNTFRATEVVLTSPNLLI